MAISQREKEIYKVTAAGSAVNVLLTILKFIGGVLGRSSAMIADAVHSLSDLVTDFIVFIFVRTASKPSDRTHEYGHGKFETLATFIVGVILIVVGIGILVSGVRDCLACFSGRILPAPTWIALAVAVISIASKEILYHVTLRVGKKWESEVVIANAWHHRSDSISSVATLIGIAGAMFLGAKWRVLDPMAATLVSFFIMKVGYDTVKPSAQELLERSLDPLVEQEIERIALSVEEVRKVDDLRTRRIGQNIAIEMKVYVEADITLRQANAVANEIERRLQNAYGSKTHVGIRMEPM